MEILILVLVAVAVPLVVLGAKRGAEAAQREREERWGGLSSGLPDSSPRPGRIAAGAGLRGTGQRVVTAPSPSASASPPPGPPAAAGSTWGSRLSMLRGKQRSDEDPAPAAAAPRAPAVTRSPARAGAARAQTAALRPPAGRPVAEPPASPRAPTAAVRRRLPPIDINRAPVTELQNLPGVGVRAAERIVAHRERHGNFVTISDLTAVEGFDEHRVSRLAPRATV